MNRQPVSELKHVGAAEEHMEVVRQLAPDIGSDEEWENRKDWAQVHATLAVANAMLAVAAELDWANRNRRD